MAVFKFWDRGLRRLEQTIKMADRCNIARSDTVFKRLVYIILVKRELWNFTGEV